jgi:hypothetical protein
MMLCSGIDIAICARHWNCISSHRPEGKSSGSLVFRGGKLHGGLDVCVLVPAIKNAAESRMFR